MNRFRIAVPLLLSCLALARDAEAQKVLVTEPLDSLELRVARDTNDAAAHYNVAMGYLGARRYADAERALLEAVSIEPRFAEAWLALYMCRNWDDAYWKRIRKERGDSGVTNALEARGRYFTRAFLIDPLVDLRILGGTYRLGGTNRWVRAFDALVEGRYAEAFEKFGKEVQFYGGVTGKTPESLLWLHSLAAARAEQRDVAIQDLRELLARYERRALADSIGEVPLEANEYRYMIAALEHRSGQLETALRLYREVLEHDVANYMAHVQLAGIYETRREWDAAILERKRALDTYPDDPTLRLDHGITLGKAGRFDEAATVLREVADAHPRDTRSLFWLGLAEEQLGRKHEARTAFDRFVTLAPTRLDRQIEIARRRMLALQ